jgi:hypothetical protein
MFKLGWLLVSFIIWAMIYGLLRSVISTRFDAWRVAHLTSNGQTMPMQSVFDVTIVCSLVALWLVIYPLLELFRLLYYQIRRQENSTFCDAWSVVWEQWHWVTSSCHDKTRCTHCPAPQPRDRTASAATLASTPCGCSAATDYCGVHLSMFWKMIMGLASIVIGIFCIHMQKLSVPDAEDTSVPFRSFLPALMFASASEAAFLTSLHEFATVASPSHGRAGPAALILAIYYTAIGVNPLLHITFDTTLTLAGLGLASILNMLGQWYYQKKLQYGCYLPELFYASWLEDVRLNNMPVRSATDGVADVRCAPLPLVGRCKEVRLGLTLKLQAGSGRPQISRNSVETLSPENGRMRSSSRRGPESSDEPSPGSVTELSIMQLSSLGRSADAQRSSLNSNERNQDVQTQLDTPSVYVHISPTAPSPIISVSGCSGRLVDALCIRALFQDAHEKLPCKPPEGEQVRRPRSRPEVKWAFRISFVLYCAVGLAMLGILLGAAGMTVFGITLHYRVLSIHEYFLGSAATLLIVLFSTFGAHKRTATMRQLQTSPLLQEDQENMCQSKRGARFDVGWLYSHRLFTRLFSHCLSCNHSRQDWFLEGGGTSGAEQFCESQGFAVWLECHAGARARETTTRSSD